MSKIIKKEVALEKIKTISLESHLFNNFRDDKDVVEEAIKINSYDIKFASNRLKNDKDLAIKVVTDCGFNIGLLSEDIKDNKEIAKIAIKNHGSALECLSERLKDDEELVLSSLERDDRLIPNISVISKRLKKDKKIALAAVKSFFLYLDQFDKMFQDDLEVILEALKQNDQLTDDIILQYASPRIQKICENQNPIIAIETEIKRIEAEELNSQLTLDLNKRSTRTKIKL